LEVGDEKMELQLTSDRDKDNEMLNVDLEKNERLFTSQNQFVDGPLAIHVAEKVKKTGINPKTGQPIKPLTAFVTCERYKEFEERMLSITIIGESQINGPAYEWKKILLQWLNFKFKVIAWRVSVRKLVGLLKDSGITFNQNDESLISPIILQWLEIFKTEVESGLELEMNMLIRE
jgi:hypothetical protein